MKMLTLFALAPGAIGVKQGIDVQADLSFNKPRYSMPNGWVFTADTDEIESSVPVEYRFAVNELLFKCSQAVDKETKLKCLMTCLNRLALLQNSDVYSSQGSVGANSKFDKYIDDAPNILANWSKFMNPNIEYFNQYIFTPVCYSPLTAVI